MGVDTLDVLADRGYFDGEEVLACEGIGVTPERGGDRRAPHQIARSTRLTST